MDGSYICGGAVYISIPDWGDDRSTLVGKRLSLYDSLLPPGTHYRSTHQSPCRCIAMEL